LSLSAGFCPANIDVSGWPQSSNAAISIALGVWE
jgi:hypothetical protein